MFTCQVSTSKMFLYTDDNYWNTDLFLTSIFLHWLCSLAASFSFLLLLHDDYRHLISDDSVVIFIMHFFLEYFSSIDVKYRLWQSQPFWFPNRSFLVRQVTIIMIFSTFSITWLCILITVNKNVLMCKKTGCFTAFYSDSFWE